MEYISMTVPIRDNFFSGIISKKIFYMTRHMRKIGSIYSGMVADEPPLSKGTSIIKAT